MLLLTICPFPAFFSLQQIQLVKANQWLYMQGSANYQVQYTGACQHLKFLLLYISSSVVLLFWSYILSSTENHVEHFQIYCVVLHEGNALGTTSFCSLICEWRCFDWVTESESHFLDVMPSYRTQTIIHKLTSVT